MGHFSRREFLAFIGGSSAAAAGVGAFAPRPAAAAPAALSFTPVRLPFPLPIFTTNSSFVATGLNGAGVVAPPSSSAELTSFTVIDDIVVPPEFERYVIVAWGDRIFPNSSDYVGSNHDFTAFIPIAGTNEGILWVNHEYTSYPFHEAAPGTSAVAGTSAYGIGPSVRAFETVVGGGVALPTLAAGENPGANVALVGEQLYNAGGTIARIRRTTRNGRFAVVSGDAMNRRVHGLSGLGLNAGRTGFPAAWGTLAYQIGDDAYLLGTGPAAADVFTGVNADTLGNKIIGTISNCSGGVTPWGTVLSAEENFQGSGTFSATSTSYPFYGGVTEGVTRTGTQTGYTANTGGATFGLLGEKYGWMVEIDPRNLGTVRAKKHTALGRFRHENFALRIEAGSALVAYSGDDRRGGHLWKYVSDGAVGRLTDPSNSALFEAGTLYVARFNPDGTKDANGMALNGTGEWIPIRLTTRCNPFDPDTLAEVQFAKQRDATGAVVNNAEITGRINLPARPGIAGSASTVTGGFFNLNRTNKSTVNPATGQTYLDDYRQFPASQGGGAKTLGDFYASLGAALVDAFGAGGLVGGTPCARPEDIEINPATKEVFIAMTDGRPGSDGYPDSRVFVTGKYTAAISAKQQSGGLYKIIEDSADGAGLTFHWESFLQGGEAGAGPAAGFANVDNLIFDSNTNLWVVTDMTTGILNAVGDGPTATQLAYAHTNVGSTANENVVGGYGNNWIFYTPTAGANAGQVIPFAIGPVRCEFTGPTFVGNTLLMSVQHPGEDSPSAAAVGSFNSTVELLKLDGSGTFNQSRVVPTGSNWPSNIAGQPTGWPRSCVVGFRRKNGGSFV